MGDLGQDQNIYLITKTENFSDEDWNQLENTKDNDLRKIYNLIEKKLHERHEGLSQQDEVAALKNIYQTITERVLFCRIIIHETIDPNEVFERLNDGGEELSTFDLLRNI